MQFGGGWIYPTNAILAILSLIILLVVVVATLIKQSGLAESLALFLSLEGTLVIACAFTPQGLSPPEPAKILNIIKHIFWSQQEGATPVLFSRRLFYSGFLLLLVAALLNFMTK